jgi:hypothetical protein
MLFAQGRLCTLQMVVAAFVVKLMGEKSRPTRLSACRASAAWAAGQQGSKAVARQQQMTRCGGRPDLLCAAFCLQPLQLLDNRRKDSFGSTCEGLRVGCELCSLGGRQRKRWVGATHDQSNRHGQKSPTSLRVVAPRTYVGCPALVSVAPLSCRSPRGGRLARAGPLVPTTASERVEPCARAADAPGRGREGARRGGGGRWL